MFRRATDDQAIGDQHRIMQNGRADAAIIEAMSFWHIVAYCVPNLLRRALNLLFFQQS